MTKDDENYYLGIFINSDEYLSAQEKLIVEVKINLFQLQRIQKKKSK